MDETLSRKLRLLADAAQYAASCSSSGAQDKKGDVLPDPDLGSALRFVRDDGGEKT